MEIKRNFNIKTPQAQKLTIKSDNGSISGQLKWNDNFAGKYNDGFLKAQEYIDAECIRRMTNVELHPIRDKVLARSATLGTAIGSGKIVQNTPYARRQYYEHGTKSRWFERMKNRDKDVILRGAQQILKGAVIK